MTVKPRVYLAPKFNDGGSLFINDKKDRWIQIDMKELKVVDKWTRVQPLDKDLLKKLTDFGSPKNGYFKKSSIINVFDKPILQRPDQHLLATSFDL